MTALKVPKSHGKRRAKPGDPESRLAWAIVEREERAQRQAAAEAENAAEITQPLIRFGLPEVVHDILQGRPISQKEIENFGDLEDCGYCKSAGIPPQPACVRITGDVESTECCVRPDCFHTALHWIDAHDTSTTSLVRVEHAWRQVVRL